MGHTPAKKKTLLHTNYQSVVSKKITKLNTNNLKCAIEKCGIENYNQSCKPLQVETVKLLIHGKIGSQK